jgi:hypothetical protein
MKPTTILKPCSAGEAASASKEFVCTLLGEFHMWRRPRSVTSLTTERVEGKNQKQRIILETTYIHIRIEKKTDTFGYCLAQGLE